MTRSSEQSESLGAARADAARARVSSTQLRLRWAAGVLAALNLVALYFYLSPPGGTRRELALQSDDAQSQLKAAAAQLGKSRNLASQVEKASQEAGAFSEKYFLPQRTASLMVLEEIQRMSKASGIQARDASLSSEPIEGSSDLTLLNITANYEGANANLMKFLNEADHSPMLLMLDTLQASPEQKSNQIAASIRFQAIVRENGAAVPKPAAQDLPSGASLGGESESRP